MSHTITHTAKKVARRLPPLPTSRTAGTLWQMLSEEQRHNVTARMMFAPRPDLADREEVLEYKRLLAEVCYEALRVRTEIEGGLEIA